MQDSNRMCEAVGTMQPVLDDNVDIVIKSIIVSPGASVSKTWKAKVKVVKTLRAGKLI